MNAFEATALCAVSPQTEPLTTAQRQAQFRKRSAEEKARWKSALEEIANDEKMPSKARKIAAAALAP